MLRKSILALIVVVGLAALGSLFINRFRYCRQELKSCFNNVQGLRAGAPVRLAGVEVGTVQSVRANPERKDCPAEVEMSLATPYEIKIPRDSITGLETAGVLGETYLEINTTQASGQPIENYGYLKSRPSIPPTSFEDYVQALAGVAKDLKDVDKEIRSPVAPPPPQRHNKSKTSSTRPPRS